MKNGIRLMAAAAAGFVLSSRPALPQDKDCGKMSVPKSVEGQVIKVEPEQGKMSVRTADGTVHEFQAEKETLQGYKSGDSLKATLRTAPKCGNK